MTITQEINDFNDLAEQLWCCDETIALIREQGREDEAFELIEQAMDGQDLTAVNDYVRFDLDEEMGLYNEDGDDDSDYEDEDLTDAEIGDGDWTE